jgi:PAS domain S-box-containing protein
VTPETLGKLVGLLVGLLALGRAVWAGVVHVRAGRRQRQAANEAAQAQLRELSDTVTQQLLPAITGIQAQLVANGGGSLRDLITDLRNEHALERAARRVMTNVASFEVKVTGDEAQVLHVSPAWVHLTGLTREDCEDDGWLRSVHEDDRDRVAAGASRAYREGKVFVTTYRTFNVHGGPAVRVEHTGTPVFNTAGHCVGWVAVVRPRDVDVIRAPAGSSGERAAHNT